MGSPMSPVCRSAYSSLPKPTAAAAFLANFANCDSDEEPDHIEDGVIIGGGEEAVGAKAVGAGGGAGVVGAGL